MRSRTVRKGLERAVGVFDSRLDGALAQKLTEQPVEVMDAALARR